MRNKRLRIHGTRDVEGIERREIRTNEIRTKEEEV